MVYIDKSGRQFIFWWQEQNMNVRLAYNHIKNEMSHFYLRKRNTIENKKYNDKRWTNIKKIMKRLKINGCAICGYDDCDKALVFHHTNPNDKSFSLSTDGLGRRNDTIANELNKCILLCTNCHVEVHEGLQKNNKFIKSKSNWKPAVSKDSEEQSTFDDYEEDTDEKD